MEYILPLSAFLHFSQWKYKHIYNWCKHSFALEHSFTDILKNLML